MLRSRFECLFSMTLLRGVVPRGQRRGPVARSVGRDARDGHAEHESFQQTVHCGGCGNGAAHGVAQRGAHQVGPGRNCLGWRFRIRTDSAEGRVRVDSVDSEQPRREKFCGILLQSVWAFRPYRNGFRIRSWVGFGCSVGFLDPGIRIPQPWILPATSSSTLVSRG